MSKFQVVYELDAADLSDAVTTAYLLLLGDEDGAASVSRVSVSEVGGSGRAFGERAEKFSYPTVKAGPEAPGEDQFVPSLKALFPNLFG